MNFPAPATLRGIDRVIVLDTETTGLQRYDRIISLAALSIEGNRVMPRSLYLCFDPRKDSSPEAEQVHGWDNWTTRFQDLFDDHADSIRDWLQWGDKLVMHNAQFDMHYIQRELRKSGRDILDLPTDCTLERARMAWTGQRCGLDDCADRIGASRRQGLHSALQDTFYTAALYLHFHGKAPRVPETPKWPMPRNFVLPPPRPEGVLPRRSQKKPKRG